MLMQEYVVPRSMPATTAAAFDDVCGVFSSSDDKSMLISIFESSNHFRLPFDFADDDGFGFFADDDGFDSFVDDDGFGSFDEDGFGSFVDDDDGFNLFADDGCSCSTSVCICDRDGW